jgi:hypothetical protein
MLDTTTGAARRVCRPRARPGSTAPGGKLWVPQTAGVLEVLDTATLQVVDCRTVPVASFASAATFWIDGALDDGFRNSASSGTT